MNDLLFLLLRRALGFSLGEETIPQEIDWHNTIETLRSHALLAVAADAIMSMPEEMRPSLDLQMQVMQYTASVARMHHKHIVRVVGNQIKRIF